MIKLEKGLYFWIFQNNGPLPPPEEELAFEVVSWLYPRPLIPW